MVEQLARARRPRWTLSAAGLGVFLLCVSAGCAGTPLRSSVASSVGGSATAPPPSSPASVSLAPSSSPDPVQPKAGEPWLAYTARAANGNFGVNLVRLDGSGVHAPTDGIPGQFQEHPDWSPDGNRLVLSETAADGTKDLWVADIDGSHATQIVDCQTPCVWADEAAWSPDGKSIVFHRMVATSGRRVSTLELFNVANSTTRILLTAKNGRAFYAPRWSPDGQSLVAEDAQNGATLDDPPSANAIAVVDLSATSPTLRDITAPDRLANNPDWSSQGDLIVFCLPAPSAGFDGPADLYVIAPGGGPMRRLTSLVEAGGRAIQPTFTPDGSAVLFVLDGPPATDRGLASVPVTGGDPRPAVGSSYIGGVHPRLRP